jgi:hypothetical protein
MQKDVPPDVPRMAAKAEELSMDDPWMRGPHTSLPAASYPSPPRSRRREAPPSFFPGGLQPGRTKRRRKSSKRPAQPSQAHPLHDKWKPSPPQPPPPTDDA